MDTVQFMTHPITYPGFRHAVPMPIRWADLDSLGHVNNALYLTYLEQARIHFINALEIWDGKPDKIGMIMAKVVMEFKLPLVANDEIVVYTRVARLGNKSYDTEQHIVRHNDGQTELAASALITIAVYDYRIGQSVIIPDDWRQRLAAHSPQSV
jgi:acyl-CoA thioester hydrolase